MFLNEGCADLDDACRLAGLYLAGRILNAHKSEEWPVQQSTKIKMIVGLKAAGAEILTPP